MGSDKQPSKKARIVVPTTPRAVAPKAPRTRGIRLKPAILDAAIIVVATLFTTLSLLFISDQLHDTTSGNLIARSAAPQLTSFGQPTPPPPRAAQPTRSPTTPTPTPVVATAPSDAAMQTEIKKRIADDPSLASLGIAVTVANSKATLTGSVLTDELREKIEKLAWAVKGIKDVENKIEVAGVL